MLSKAEKMNLLKQARTTYLKAARIHRQAAGGEDMLLLDKCRTEMITNLKYYREYRKFRRLLTIIG